VSRAIERNRAMGLPTDYESLSLPAETRSYVPKLIAVKNIVSDPARYGLQIDEIENEPYFESVALKQHMDVKLAAEMARIPLHEFMLLNPGHTRPVIRAGEAEQIVLPKDAITVFRENLQRNTKPLLTWKTIRLRRGEQVRHVAAEHGMTLEELKTVNGLLHSARVVTGQPLLVRTMSGAADSPLADIAAKPVSLPAAIHAAKLKAGAVVLNREQAHVHRKLPLIAVRKSARERVKLPHQRVRTIIDPSVRRTGSRRR
jgi:membrane-bound lytic murein transglycosylase D